MDLPTLMGFTNPDTGIRKEIADASIVLLHPSQVWNGRSIPHLLQNVAILNLPTAGVSFLGHIVIQPNALIGSYVQAVAKD